MDSDKPNEEKIRNYEPFIQKKTVNFSFNKTDPWRTRPNYQRTAIRSKYVGNISLKEVKDLKYKHPEQIVFQLSNPRFGIDNYLNAETIDNDLIYNLTFVFLKSFGCHSMSIKLSEIAKKLIESRFFTEHLYESIYKSNNETNIYNTNLIGLVVKLITEILFIDPYYVNNLKAIKDRLEILIYIRIGSNDLKDLFQVYVKQEKESLEKIEKRKNTTFTNLETDAEPQDDFTTMNIVPKLNDILVGSQEVFLRKNITNGSYKNVHHYLDVQFRLLREDFMKPLRDGVCEFRKIVHESGRKLDSYLSKEMIHKIKKIENLNTYFDVRLSNSIPCDHGIVFEMQFDKDKFKSFNWENSKRLIFGSLVCFSSDYFLNECLIGVICERDEKSLNQKGCFNVKFDYDSIQLDFECLPEFNKSYIMLETLAFFESYRHVLKALQSFQREGENNFPFKENLVYCQNTDMPIPKYLKDACIDFRTLVDVKKSTLLAKTFSLAEFYNRDYEFSESVDYAEKCFISNEASWPSAEQMKLDELQYEAIKLALKNKLALIQGPPGTGKTFLGVKIVQLLLHNSHLWLNREHEKRKPILMICYTNHALDQFLEYCIKECNLSKGIVRVGGQSTSKNLPPFFLKNIKQKYKQNRQMDTNIVYESIEHTKEISKLKHEISYLSSMLNSIFFGDSILKLKELKNVMNENHFNQLFESGYNFNNVDEFEDDYYLIDWLGLFEINKVKSLIEDFKQLNLKGHKRGDKFKEQNKNEVLEQENEKINGISQKSPHDIDNALLNDERMLEDDFEPSKSTQFKNFDELLKIDNLANMVKRIKDIRGIKNDGWKIVDVGGKTVFEDEFDLKKNLKIIFSHVIEKFNETNFEFLENSSNIWRLNYPERFLLYFQWINKFLSNKQTSMHNLRNRYNEAAAALKEIQLQEDRVIMEDAWIIAMTTTGSSRYHSVLKDIGPRIVIVEEAAEVFEAHIVSSLSKHCEHLILIGDHVQLRPNPAVYSLATKYRLDVSLFERLIRNDTKRVMLNNQHRMRPEISILMQHFYDNKILDNSSVSNYPNIKGLKKNVFFIEHFEMETRLSENNTKSNIFEAEYLSKLCLYLIKQDYKESSITVLSMYLGQIMEIRRLLRNMGMSNIKVSTVDNYQGEENDIILLSLVRSNPDNKIGFLNIKNRVCVALSRARHGFYVIGNLKFICESEKGDIWKSILKTIKNNQFYGSSLTVTCGYHPQNDIEVSRPEHFDERTDGGCHLPCGFRLECGHVCPKKCHFNSDSDHLLYKCLKKCHKPIVKCGHLCEEICSNKHSCIECRVMVDKIIQKCGHLIKFRCDSIPMNKDCIYPCTKILKCGHICTKMCKEICGKCLTKVQVKSNCKHQLDITVLCSDPEWTYHTKCTEPCNEILDCGHVCSGTCGICFGGRIHQSCDQKCDRLLFCSHKCDIPCAKQCQQCHNPCNNKCEHSSCRFKCSDPCVPCREKCLNSCKHSKCSKFCYEVCDREPCNRPCKNKLKCGHKCIGLCGEICPELCRICNNDIIGEIFFGTEDERNARFIQLNDCGHTLEVSGMDNWISSRFGDDENSNDGKNNTIQLPDCPKCKTPIRRSKRYSNVIKKQLQSIENIKLKHYGDPKENEIIQKNLLNEIKNFNIKIRIQNIDSEIREAILNKLENSKSLSFNSLAGIKNTWNIYENLKKNEKKNLYNREEQKELLNFEIDKILNLLINYNQISMFRVGQKLNDILAECERISNLTELFRLKNKAQSCQVEDSVKTALYLDEAEMLLIKNVTKFDNKVKERIEIILKELCVLLRTEITQEEKTMIIKAMELGKGHWFKCPNGHIYCIGECGGAMEKAICPECQCDIGGEKHKLVEKNQLASEMDGATQPAYPTALI